MDEMVFRLQPVAGGWVVQGATWTSAIMAKADAINLAEGMATVVRGTGQAVRVIVQDAGNDLRPGKA
jgi:hypothetical protein